MALTQKDIEQIKLALQAGHWVEIGHDNGVTTFVHYSERENKLITSEAGRSWHPNHLYTCLSESYKVIPRPQYEYKVGQKVVRLQGYFKGVVTLTECGVYHDEVRVLFDNGEHTRQRGSNLMPLVEEGETTVKVGEQMTIDHNGKQITVEVKSIK